jgi:hypothetical protein
LLAAGAVAMPVSDTLTKDKAVEEVVLRLTKESGEALDSYSFHIREAFKFQQRLEKLLSDIVSLKWG